MGVKLVLALGLLLPVVFSAQCSTSDSTECNFDIFKCCDTNLREHLGINNETCPKTTWESPDCISQAMNIVYFAKGKEGVYKTCDAYNDFRACLGRGLRSCTTSDYHIRSGLDVYHAKALQALYSSHTFTCGPGLETMLYNEECIIKTYRSKYAELGHCLITYQNNIRRNPRRACDWAKELTGCFELEFSKECNAESAWWACELQRTYTSGFHPSCDTKCTAFRHTHFNAKAAEQTN